MKVSDEEWSGLINLLTDTLYQITERKIVSIEGLRIIDEYPEFVFRITSVKDLENENIEIETVGLVVGVSLNDYDDVFVENVTEEYYRKEWLIENNITHNFGTYHVGTKHVFDYLNRRLSLWSETDPIKPLNNFPTDKWRILNY